MMIKYYSTNLKAQPVGFREALLKGLAPDGGLYMPSHIPKLPVKEMEKFSSLEYHEIACEVLKSLLFDEISSKDLEAICRNAYNFVVPLEKVNDRKYILRLDQGPTSSFKDFAARMMARLMHHFISRAKMHFTILAATSGDTGSAVASAFHGLDNINVIILFPAKEVSDIQRKQMTTLHDNVKVISLDGKFDDCQRLVKMAFNDQSLSDIPLSSANSINIGRLLPQSVYYFYAWAKLKNDYDDKVIFSVPSGNFGNLMGGIIAREMGLPVRKFIISTNSNNEVPELLRTGFYKAISPSINCISSAMNVGHPSNLARIVAYYGGLMDESGAILKNPDLRRMRDDFYGVSVSDEETRSTIFEFYKNKKLILEPHGAIAWEGMKYYENLSDNNKNQLFVSLETAHPAKFNEEIKSILGFSLPFPESLRDIDSKKEEFMEMENNYEELRSYIRTLNK
jgi:threonine synthase